MREGRCRENIARHSANHWEVMGTKGRTFLFAVPELCDQCRASGPPRSHFPEIASVRVLPAVFRFPQGDPCSPTVRCEECPERRLQMTRRRYRPSTGDTEHHEMVRRNFTRGSEMVNPFCYVSQFSDVPLHSHLLSSSNAGGVNFFVLFENSSRKC